VIYFGNQHMMFLHTPKVAGTWLRRVFISHVPGAQSVGYEHGDRSHADEFANSPICTFCFVRHPLEWYRSFWAHRELVGWGGDFAIARDCMSRDFNTFAITCAELHPGFLSDLYARFTHLAAFVGD
jgi:hypothetical protein